MSRKPTPLVTERVCTLCGLDWDRHGDKPSKDDCIQLLRSELAMRPAPFMPWGQWTFPQQTWPLSDVWAGNMGPAIPGEVGTVTYNGIDWDGEGEE